MKPQPRARPKRIDDCAHVPITDGNLEQFEANQASVRCACVARGLILEVIWIHREVRRWIAGHPTPSALSWPSFQVLVSLISPRRGHSSISYPRSMRQQRFIAHRCYTITPSPAPAGTGSISRLPTQICHAITLARPAASA